jgi:FAD/FMN-containing dehydrogenase
MHLLEAEAVGRFRSGFSGDIIQATDDGYDVARSVFNAMIDRRPAVIAQCQSSDDVVAALAFAADNGLEVAVRGGGHSVAGKALSEGGLVIDLRRMNDVSVDPVAMTCRVGGGATMGDLDRATQPFGLATTGVGGFALGGGTGWLDRKFGLACDNLVAVDLVTADGHMVTASDTQNRELFWALHGGGGNFGVATALTFRLYPLPSVTAALMLWPAEGGPKALKAFRDYIETAPDEVGGGAIYMTGPDLEFVPDQLKGGLVFGELLVFAGGEAEARKAWGDMLALDQVGEMVAEMPYAELQCMLDDPPGHRNYWSADYLRALPDEAIDRFCARSPDMIVPSASQHVLFPGGGKAAREPADWPIPWRRAAWCVHPFGLWTDPADDARGKQWAHDIRADLKPWSTGDVYLNFIGDEGGDRLIAGFGRENYGRLARVKAQYDPRNIFHLNHNIRPD